MATYMPLFEWHINEVVTTFPATYQVDIPPSPLRARLGESLDDKSFVFRRFDVATDQGHCSAGNMNSVVKRSWNEEILERLLFLPNINYRYTSWLLGWGLIEIALAGIYIWWSTIRYEHRPISDAVNSTIFAGIFSVLFFCYVQIPLMKIMGPIIDFGFLDDCQGTLTFSAQLVKLHYETVSILLVGILAEIGALGIMFRQVSMAANKRRESTQSVVG